MRYVSILFCLLCILAPSAAHAEVVEKWLFRTPSDTDMWYFTNVSQGQMTEAGFTFSVSEQAVMYRPLPQDIVSLDEISIIMSQSTLERVEVLLVQSSDTANVTDSLRMTADLDPSGTTHISFPIAQHQSILDQYDTVALAFYGDAEHVSIDSIRFLRTTFNENAIGAWRSFWTFRRFAPHSINVLIGAVIDPTIGKFGVLDPDAIHYTTSANVYFIQLFVLYVCVLLVCGGWWFFRRHARPAIGARILRLFLVGIVVVWLVNDGRMTAEFLWNVWEDHRTYTFQAPGERTFRDPGGAVYDFSQFVQPLVHDRTTYDLFLMEQWPYFGMMRYGTYPAVPLGLDEISTDTLVVFNRADITVGTGGRLWSEGVAFTSPGRVLGRYDDHSFVFRIDPSSPDTP